MLANLEYIFKQCIMLTKPFSIIIANGEAPKDKYLLHILQQANCLLCCDGAINMLQLNNIEPDYIIGDCDSLTSIQKQQYADKIKYVPDQNFNDLTKAVNFAVDELGLENIIILGATGLREDHSLANIALLAQYAQKVKTVFLISDYGVFSVHNGIDIISTVVNQQISLFAVNTNTHATTLGLKWDINNLVLDSWYKGTLNHAIGTSFELHTNLPVIVYRAFEVK